MLDQIVQDLKDRGWSHSLGVLNFQQLKDLNLFFDEHREEFVPAKVGHNKNLHRNEKIRGDFTRWIENDQKEFQPVFQFISDLKKTLNENFFLGLKGQETHLAFYPPGYFYQKHLDRFETGSSRVVSIVFYLHEEWNISDGGELILYNKENILEKIIQPIPGSLAIFMSEEFPHEVKLCHKERRSFTGWIHNQEFYDLPIV